ncbi:MAG: peptide deformylase [Minisyncoccales bacterium]|jgi:peptide deformylase
MTLEINKDLKFLRKRSKEILEVDNDLKKLISDMTETMNCNNGVGLAAPQVGILSRLIIAKIDGKDLALINPKIVFKNREKETMEEGCLSLPDVVLEIERPTQIRVKATDVNGDPIELNLRGLSARIVQHEIDHLNGKLITDRTSLLYKIRNLFKKKR